MAERQAIRSFVCIEIPSPVSSQIEELQGQLASSRADVSWVKKTNVHLTLKFLGNISPYQVEDVCRSLSQITEQAAPLDLRIGGTGCFPNDRNPRIIWVGLVNSSPRLRELHSSIDRELSKLGFAGESRPFSPHLTIGRVKSRRNTVALAERLKTCEFRSEPFAVDQIILMKSELKSSGAVYSPIRKFALKLAKSSAL
jgi:2'-5' RNA ligase